MLLNTVSLPHLLYLVSEWKVDVSGAYESLPHDKLIEVISQVLSPIQDELFTIRRYAKIWADSHEGLKKAFVRQVPSYTHSEHNMPTCLYTHTQYSNRVFLFVNTGRFPGG